MAVAGEARRILERVRVLDGILPYEQRDLSGDVIAGLTLAALAIPEVMAFTLVAHMPVVTGLYTLLLPMLMFAMLGSSRHLVVAADVAVAAVMAAGLVGLADPGTPDWVSLAALTALMAGGLLILARLLRIGFLADFLSRTVLIGFLAGVGIVVAIAQIGPMLGEPGGSSQPLQQLLDAIAQLSKANLLAILFSAATIALVWGAQRFAARVPGALIAVLAAIVVSWIADVSRWSVAVVGPVAGGFPRPSIPTTDASSLSVLAGTAFGIGLLIVAQSATTSRAYAMRFGEPLDEDTDVIGLAAANAAAGLTGTFPVTGSPTRTSGIVEAGGRTQVAMLVTSAIVLAVVIVLAGPLRYLPVAVLGAIVFTVGVELVDWLGLQDIARVRREEFILAGVTLATVVVVGVMQGLMVAIVLSLIIHVQRSYFPHTEILTRLSDGQWRGVRPELGMTTLPGVLIYRFDADLYFANANRFSEQVVALAESATPAARWVVVDCSPVTDVDYTAAGVIAETAEELRRRGVVLALAEIDEPVRVQLRRYGTLGTDVRWFATLADAYDAFRSELRGPVTNVSTAGAGSSASQTNASGGPATSGGSSAGQAMGSAASSSGHDAGTGQGGSGSAGSRTTSAEPAD